MTAELLHARDYSLVRADASTVFGPLDLTVGRGEIVGVLGESGSGKSQLLLSLLGLAMPRAVTQGSARFEGQELVGAGELIWQRLRGCRVAMLFQDPLLTWNPYLTIGMQLCEVPERHFGVTRAEARRRAVAALGQVGLTAPEELLARYPHELSGGMRQRALLAMAVLGEPDLLLADEPTTALDASTQIAVLDLLAALRRERGMSIVLVSHDLGVLARVADRLVVLQAGRIVEQGETRQLLAAPESVHARELIAATRRLEQRGATS
jgi:ABC-type glutathione transport system ATPase component